MLRHSFLAWSGHSWLQLHLATGCAPLYEEVADTEKLTKAFSSSAGCMLFLSAMLMDMTVYLVQAVTGHANQEVDVKNHCIIKWRIILRDRYTLTSKQMSSGDMNCTCILSSHQSALKPFSFMDSMFLWSRKTRFFQVVHEARVQRTWPKRISK